MRRDEVGSVPLAYMITKLVSTSQLGDAYYCAAVHGLRVADVGCWNHFHYLFGWGWEQHESESGRNGCISKLKNPTLFPKFWIYIKNFAILKLRILKTIFEKIQVGNICSLRICEIWRNNT